MLRKKALKEKASTKAARKVRRKRRATKAKLDQMARAQVMERDHYRCQLAGIGTVIKRDKKGKWIGREPLICTPMLQWMHIKSRRYLSTRWLPANSVAGCAAHHRWAHDNPDEFIGWWSTTYPERAVEVKHVFNNSGEPRSNSPSGLLEETAEEMLR